MTSHHSAEPLAPPIDFEAARRRLSQEKRAARRQEQSGPVDVDKRREDVPEGGVTHLGPISEALRIQLQELSEHYANDVADLCNKLERAVDRIDELTGERTNAKREALSLSAIVATLRGELEQARRDRALLEDALRLPFWSVRLRRALVEQVTPSTI